MENTSIEKVFTKQFLEDLLPLSLSDQFFEALYGEASEGAYDIGLEFVSADNEQIVLSFNLIQRPDKCLVCSLTYGLPNVFSRHPLINIGNMVKKIEQEGIKVKEWRLGRTQEIRQDLHKIPFYLDLE